MTEESTINYFPCPVYGPRFESSTLRPRRSSTPRLDCLLVCLPDLMLDSLRRIKQHKLSVRTTILNFLSTLVYRESFWDLGLGQGGVIVYDYGVGMDM